MAEKLTGREKSAKRAEKLTREDRSEYFLMKSDNKLIYAYNLQ